jgi:hypothetical protein
MSDPDTVSEPGAAQRGDGLCEVSFSVTDRPERGGTRRLSPVPTDHRWARPHVVFPA